MEHLGLGYLAAILRQNDYKVEIVDANLLQWDTRKTIDEISRKNFDMIGISMYQQALDVAIEIARNVKRKNDIHVTVGCHFPTFTFNELLAKYGCIDFVVLGEGEYTLLELTKSIENGDRLDGVLGIAYRDKNGTIKVNSPRKLIENLDDLPFPSRDTLSILKKNVVKRFSDIFLDRPIDQRALERIAFASILSSRGCHGNCSFCSIRSFYGTSAGLAWRARNPTNVINEIEHLMNEHDAKYFFFTDADFIGPGRIGRDRARKFALEIHERGLEIEYGINCRPDNVDRELLSALKKSGLRHIYLGVESGIQRALKTFNKNITVEQSKRAIRNIRKLNLSMKIGFILFDPYITLQEVRKNYEFLEDTDFLDFDLLVTKLVVFCGSPIEKELRDDRLIQGTELMPEYKFIHPEISNLLKLLTEYQKMTCSLRRRLRPIRDLTSRKEVPSEHIRLLLSMLERRESSREQLHTFETIYDQLKKLDNCYFEEAIRFVQEEEIDVGQFLRKFKQAFDLVLARARILGVTLPRP